MPTKPSFSYISDVKSLQSVLDELTIPVRRWINDTFDKLNTVQRMAIPRIIENKSTLVMAPTGAGKTLAAFLGIISELHNKEENNELEDRIYALYISPLKALNNDIHKNLEVPLSALKEKSGSNITAAKRTGDTPAKKRKELLKNPPHILITTPESLGLMLASPKFKNNLRDIEWLIIDEIHSLADNKRGSLLSICLERLEYYLERPLTRIGLSATVEPIHLVGNYLIGNRDQELGIIDMGGLRKLEIDVISPVRNLVSASFSIIEKNHLEHLKEYTENNDTVLIFTNTRHLSERLVYDLVELVDEEYKNKISVHHGSLDKEVRLDVENRLKKGKMKAVFTSTSLEMGIDIGSIDLTVQLGSPKNVRSLLQRIGRSGHSQELTSRGKILVFTREDLLECTVIAKLAKEAQIDAIRIPEKPYDVLIQMLVGMAIEKKWDFHQAYEVISKAYPYRELTYSEFLRVLKTAADPTEGEDSWKYGHIWVDEDIEEFGKRRSARQAYLQNIGTIPDVSSISVVLQGFRTTIGQISEKFAEKLREDDIFILGGKTYQFVRSIGNKILVQESPGSIPTVPSWGGEAQTRTWEVSTELNRMLQNVEKRLEGDKSDAISWLCDEYPIGTKEAEAITDYIIEQLTIAPLPKMDEIVVESYKDPSGAVNILALMIYGLETNEALAQALAGLLSDKLETNIAFVATDNGMLLKLPPGTDYDHSMIFDELKGVNLDKEIKTRLIDTEMFKLRFRYAAARSLMILRKWGRKNISVSQQQRSSRWLLQSLEMEMPVIQETFREILHDRYDVDRAQQIVTGIETKDISINALPPSDIPSSMTHDILLNGELDVVMMNDRRSLLMSLHQQVLSRLLPEMEEYSSILDRSEVKEYFSAKFDPSINLSNRINRWIEMSYFNDFSIERGVNKLNLEESTLRARLEELDNIIHLENIGYMTTEMLPYIASTRGESFWDDLDLGNPLIEQSYVRSKSISPDEGWQHLITKYLFYNGPTTLEELVNSLNTSKSKLSSNLNALQRRNIILRGHFISEKDEYILFEDREKLYQHLLPQTQISEEQLKNYRLYKMRLVKRNRSNRLSILDYLRENGPARDPIELVSRINSFSWSELRNHLSKREVYFGRFLGRRLVFIHHSDLEDFVNITRTDNDLEPLASEILFILSENPGYTQKELSKITRQPSSKVGQALKQLEEELYIARTGFDLTLTHGGFPNPRYIPLPSLESNKSSYQQSVINILEKCCRWYGPLTLNDFLRITRLPYPVIETALEESDLDTRKILNQLYYGQEYDFEELEDFKLEEGEKDEVHLLSPLDPYFYMTSGSFRKKHLPRQTRLTVVHDGIAKAYVEITIPDKDLLQVLNVQMAKRRLSDFNFVREIASKIREIAKRAYKTPAVYIEEINFKAANHPDNSIVVNLFEEVGYRLQIDHLVTGTRKDTSFSTNDVISTRQLLYHTRKKEKYKSYDEIFSRYPVLSIQQSLDLIDTNHNDAKLLLSHYLRSGKVHYFENKIYRHDIFTVLHGREKEIDSKLEGLSDIKTSSQISKELDLDKDETRSMIYELLNEGVIELVSPFSQTPEYRLRPINSYSYPDQIKKLSLFIITKFGPLPFKIIQDKIASHLEVSRMQLLIKLIDLMEKGKIFSASIRDTRSGTKQVMYFTEEQEDILTDPSKRQYFEEWNIYQRDDLIFDNLDIDGDHVITHYNIPIVSFYLKRDNDTALLEDIQFTSQSSNELDSDDLQPLLGKIEEFIHNKGLRRIQINKIHGTPPNYWLDLGE